MLTVHSKILLTTRADEINAAPVQRCRSMGETRRSAPPRGPILGRKTF